MKKIKKNWPFYGVIIINYYALPCCIQDTGSGIFILMAVMPLICFFTAIVYGIKNGFCVYFPVISAILFIPTIFIFYNVTAWPYTIIFTIILLFGNLFALPLHRKTKENTKGEWQRITHSTAYWHKNTPFDKIPTHSNTYQKESLDSKNTN